MKAALLREYHRPLELVDRRVPEPAGSRPSGLASRRSRPATRCFSTRRSAAASASPAGAARTCTASGKSSPAFRSTAASPSTSCGTDATHAAALAALGPRGTFAVIGYGGTISANSGQLVSDEQAIVANLVGSWIDLWEVLQLHAAGRIRLVTEQHPFDAVNDVLASLRDGEVTGRAVLVP